MSFIFRFWNFKDFKRFKNQFEIPLSTKELGKIFDQKMIG